MKILNNILIIAMISFTVSSCKKLDIAPTDRFTDITYWTTTEKADRVVNTAYSQITHPGFFFFNEALSDNAYNSRGDVEGVASIAAGTSDASLSRYKNEWNWHYTGIKTCNIFLENVDRVPNMDAALKERRKAEIRFIRAYHYFMLYTWYGDVPLFDHDITLEESRTITRTPKAQVVDFVLKELDEAANVLPINTALSADDKGRITKGAALALKARALLYESRWADVVTICEQLMGGTTGTYSLFPSYEGLFLPQNEYNNEVIFDIGYVPELRAYNTLFDFVPISVGARLNNFAATQELVDSYLMTNGKTIRESGSGYDENNPYVNRDPRFGYTLVHHLYKWKRPDGTTKTIYIKPGSDPDQVNKFDEYGGTITSATGYYLRKYYDPTSSTNFLSGLNLIMIRYADVLLMYAEAKNELGQMNETVWNNTVRAIRNRAGFTDPGALAFNSALSQTNLRDIIRNERRVEFAMEGLRIFDIRRWKTAEQVLNGWAHGAKYGPPDTDNGYVRVNLRQFDPAKHYLWPVPRDERNMNANLTQNPGW